MLWEAVAALGILYAKKQSHGHQVNCVNVKDGLRIMADDIPRVPTSCFIGGHRFCLYCLKRFMLGE